MLADFFALFLITSITKSGLAVFQKFDFFRNVFTCLFLLSYIFFLLRFLQVSRSASK